MSQHPPAGRVEGGARSPARPRLLFVRPRTETLPAFIASHFVEQARCLEQWFDVTVVPPEGDYAALCETHRPDLAVFESGSHLRGARTLTNPHACPEIPKLGFLNSDAYCPTRRAFLSDMDHWGVETFFTHAVSMAEYTPEIADRLFVWPNSIDPRVYRDYGTEKNIPVLLTGSRLLVYPWRNQIMDRVSQTYPTFRTPHFGTRNRANTSRMIHGEDYARLIGASLFAPTCGTVVHEVVRKHFEIPACRTCLLTEYSPGLAAAGFVDMENCVVVDTHDVIDKLDYLLANPDTLHAITDRGYALVHERHTWANRDQILQWYNLNRALRRGQRIVQLGPFGRLVAVDDRSPLNHGHIYSRGRYGTLLGEAAERIQAGDIQHAETLYLRCMNHVDYAAEPCLGMAICALNKGDAERALQWMGRLLYELDDCKVDDPDPVEWAYFIIGLLCLGRVDEAARSAAQYPALRHPELTRTRLALARLNGRPAGPAQDEGETTTAGRLSIHRLPSRSDDAWFANLAAMARASGQRSLAERLRRPGPIGRAVEATRSARRASAPQPVRGDQARPREKLSHRLRRHALRTLADPTYPVRFLATHGRRDEFCELVAREAADVELASVLLVADRHWSWSAHALLNGIRRNPALPILLRVGSARSLDLDTPLSQALVLPAPTTGGGLRREMADRGVRRFDLVLIDGVAPPDFQDREALADAAVVLINRLDTERNQLIARDLLQPGSGYELTHSSPEHNGGYAGFRLLREQACPRRRYSAASVTAAKQPGVRKKSSVLASNFLANQAPLDAIAGKSPRRRTRGLD